ncbi:hypothetical protein LZ30DRAFT_299471 [Colletotrichum cereale]|nr:hypothetical protein LZ30DRAFT_299471 [Colletotrichum cereale]
MPDYGVLCTLPTDTCPSFPQSDSDLTHHHFFSLPGIHTHPPTFLHIVVAARGSPVPVGDHAASPPLLKRPDAPPGASPSTLDPRPSGPSLRSRQSNHPLWQCWTTLSPHRVQRQGLTPAPCLHCFEKSHRSAAILPIHPALPPAFTSKPPSLPLQKPNHRHPVLTCPCSSALLAFLPIALDALTDQPGTPFHPLKLARLALHNLLVYSLTTPLPPLPLPTPPTARSPVRPSSHT